MNQQPVGQDGHGIAPWASQGQNAGKGQQAVGQKGQNKGKGQQPVGQNGHGIAWGSQGGEGKGKGQQAVGQDGHGVAPWAQGGQQQQLVNGMPPSDVNGVPVGPYAQQEQPSWQSWFQDAISPATSERVLSTPKQAERPGKGFGRHPWWEEQGSAEKGPTGHHQFRHWDRWKKTHAGEVKVEFMCLK